jgi:hypothetical protein
MDDDDPTGYHGIVHDAAGYLYNYHNKGPGYNYLGKEKKSGHNTSDPLTGQESGMRFWHEKLDPGLKTKILCGAIDGVYAARDTAEDVKAKLDDARKSVGQSIDAAMASAGVAKQKAKTAIEKAAQEAALAATAAKARVEQSATATLENAKEALGNIKDLAAAKIEAARDFILS